MATDSSMKNISGVENYARSLDRVCQDLKRTFNQLKKQTDFVGQNWSDSQFNEFRAQFNESIMKQIDGICLTLDRLSKYTKKQCEFHHMAKNHRL